MNNVVSQRYGIVSRVVNIQSDLSDVDVYGCTAHVQDSADLSYDISDTTAGFSLDSPEHAEITAIMEGLERYSSAFIYESDIREYSEICGSTVLSFLDRYEADIDPSDLRYIEFTHTTSGETVYLPAQYAYFPSRALGETHVFENTTNGLAAHTSVEAAVENAVFELVEREALLRWWLNGYAPPQVSLDGTPFEQIEQNLDTDGLKLEVFQINITNALATTIALITTLDDEKPSLSFGSSTAHTLWVAVESAIEEAIHMRVWQRKYFDGKPEKPGGIDSIYDRGQYWSSESSFEKLDFLYQNELTIDLMSTQQTQGVEEITDADLPDIYYTDLTIPQLQSVGVTVVRAYSPDFHPFPLLWEDRVHPNGREIVDAVETDVMNDDIPHPLM